MFVRSENFTTNITPILYHVVASSGNFIVDTPFCTAYPVHGLGLEHDIKLGIDGSSYYELLASP